METIIDNQENQPQPPIDADPTSTVSNGTPKKSYLPWILGIFILAIVLAAFFFILTGKSKSTPTSSLKPPVSQKQTKVAATDIDTSSWKTYTIPFGNLSLPLSKQDAELENKTLTFKYPTDWKIVDRKNSNKSSNYAYDLDFYLVKSDPNEQVTCSSKDSPCSLEGISPLSTQISLSLNAIPDGTDVLSVNYWGQLNVLSKKSETYINRTKVTQGFINENDDIPSDLIFDIDKNNKLRVNIYGLDYASKETSKEIKQILSTFKFTDITTNKINLALPTGWTKSVEQANSPFDETEKYERIVLVKGSYKIEIGDPVGGGRANCNAEIPVPSTLNNSSLSSVIKRTNPNPENSSGATTLQVCSNLVSKNQLDYGTKIGFIKYLLPVNWDQAVLKEMDSIVESITLAK